MQAKSNDLHVRVSYATDCPEWWRIAVGRRLGRQGPATRAECVAFLRRFGESEDDNLALEFERWNEAAAEGEEVSLAGPRWAAHYDTEPDDAYRSQSDDAGSQREDFERYA